MYEPHADVPEGGGLSSEELRFTPAFRREAAARGMTCDELVASRRSAAVAARQRAAVDAPRAELEALQLRRYLASPTGSGSHGATCGELHACRPATAPVGNFSEED